ncbi:MAG: sulfite exporter TauE/SafE family protein [Treponema sp.]|jgi:sulfite exporter TauE/SafE/copper chaperone CopZ/plastocyanin domain-containing protein|nr:sulfite exporter TauE/SafE family protein [Treponema sp.]
MDDLKSTSFRIGGMTCTNCRDRIEGALKSTPGVEHAEVNFAGGTAAVTYDPAVLGLEGIRAVVERLGYKVVEGKAGIPAMEIAGTLAIVFALYMLLRGVGIGGLASAFPLAEAGMGYGMLFLIGLITSVHCVAMCGGINLSQCMSALPAVSPPEGRGAASPGVSGRQRRAALFPAILYNAGRLVSYTAAGVLAGALGSVISVSGRFQGLIQLAAGVFMVIMGINMLGLFPVLRRVNIRLPRFFTRKTGEAARGPLFVGLLNGLMPCGPLQAMQLYALSTGSPIAGGVSMFLFCMGTIPLMFGIGAVSSILSNTAKGPAFRRAVAQAGGILITVMGMTMFSYGFNLSGFNIDLAGKAMAAINPFAAATAGRRSGASAPETIPLVENGVQIVNSTLSGGRYPVITVQRGIPVKWTINAPQGSVNGCNNRMIIREYGIEHRFRPGENIIEFTPSRPGKFAYSCWMGMIRSSITVVEEGQSPAAVGEPELEPVPAGAAISTDSVALAELREGGFQAVTIALRDDGIEPAVLVLQRGIPTAWTIVNDSRDPGNSRLIFPAYYTQIDMEPGNNTIQLTPARDFDFSTADNVFYGYVKVVDDLNTVDIEAVKAEAADIETLIYPDAYFDVQSSGCCGRGGA